MKRRDFLRGFAALGLTAVVPVAVPEEVVFDLAKPFVISIYDATGVLLSRLKRLKYYDHPVFVDTSANTSGTAHSAYLEQWRGPNITRVPVQLRLNTTWIIAGAHVSISRLVIDKNSPPLPSKVTT